MKGPNRETEEKAVASIIIPVYNTDAALLSKCVESVCQQTYPCLELILIDDGSTDAGTLLCLRRLEEGDREQGRLVRLIRQDNRGVMAARKTGIDAAGGKYLLFVDSDDCIHQKYVETLTAMIESDSYDIAEVSGEEVRDILALDLDGPAEAACADRKVAGRDQLMDYLVDRVGQPLGWSLWGKIFRTGLMQKCYHVYEGIYYGEDVVSLAEYLTLCRQALISGRAMYYYNKGNARSQTSQNSVRQLTKCRFGRELVRIYQKEGTAYGYLHAKAIYIRMLFGYLLECEYRQYEGYRQMQKQFRKELWNYRADVFRNPYLTQKYKYIIAFLSTKPYILKRLIKGR